MSVFHARIRKISQTSVEVRYHVESFDFNPGRTWMPIATLVLHKDSESYSFQPGEAWTENKLLPPEFYSKDKQTQDAEFETVWGPKGYGLGAYAMTVHHYATTFLQNKSFPDTYPEVFFVNEKET